MATDQRTSTATAAPEAAAPRTLDDLARLSARELDRLYRTARPPRVEELEGALRGRMLAIPAAERAPALPALLARFARSPAFPWRGKTFRTLAPGRGEGVNRVFADRFSWFRFTTSVGRSRADGLDAVLLDYDHPGNPALVRAIKDEIREVAPGLWLGLAYVVVGKASRLALYFGLER